MIDQTAAKGIGEAVKQETQEMIAVLEVKVRRMIAEQWPTMAKHDPEGVAEMAKQMVFGEMMLFKLKRKCRNIEQKVMATHYKETKLAAGVREVKSEVVSIVDRFLKERKNQR